MNIPRIVIAGTNSGCGKTTISIGIMAALVKRGLRVQPFKVGPDYIDPMFHTFITGSDSRNLDSWILSEETVRHLFVRNSKGSDISIIEGVMGMFDGYGGYSTDGSTAHVSKLVNSPVVLVINGEGMSLSAVALLQGFINFDKEVNIQGVIINNIKSESHFSLLKQAIEENTCLTVLGYLPRLPECSLQSRHLGLIPSEEIDDLRNKLGLLAAQVEKTIDLEQLIEIARNSQLIKESGNTVVVNKGKRNVRIAVAKDRAFNFYYKDNLDLLEDLGAHLEYFSPIEDDYLPKDIDGLYIGGGYPEVWAKDLEINVHMRRNIRESIGNGLPAYVECGGLMYMSQSITTKDGQTCEMVGAVPGKSEMTSRLQRFGYVDIEVLHSNVMGNAGDKIRAHEFHYSITPVDEDVPQCYRASKERRGKETTYWQCGLKVNNLLAAYPHLHFWSNTRFAENFIDSCVKYKEWKEHR